MSQALIASSTCLMIIKAFEGIEDGDPSTVNLDPYDDPVGLPTIGWGHLIKPGEEFIGGITLRQAEALLRQDVASAERAVNFSVTVNLDQSQFDALVSLTYNIGTAAFGQSTLLEWVNESRMSDAPQQFTRWNKSKGRSLLGLARRRVQESALFLS